MGHRIESYKVEAILHLLFQVPLWIYLLAVPDRSPWINILLGGIIFIIFPLFGLVLRVSSIRPKVKIWLSVLHTLFHFYIYSRLSDCMYYLFRSNQQKLGISSEAISRGGYLDILIATNGYFLVCLGALVIYGYSFVNCYGTYRLCATNR